jgi:hypothetical protein
LIHDPELLDKLAAFKTEPFEGQTYRATRMSLDPTAYSSWGGRWAPKDDCPALYTSLEPDGAIAEISYHWGLMIPKPTKPVMLHTLNVSASQTLKLIRADLKALGVDLDRFGNLDYIRTQEIGSAVAFLDNDGLIVPSARWDCDNLILFENGALKVQLDPVGEPRQIDWQAWCKANNRGEPEPDTES